MLDSGRLYRAASILGVTLCLTISFVFLLPRLIQWNVLPDFTVFWTAGRFALGDASRVYDSEALTAAQSWAIDPSHGPRPFPYPPTALLLFIPFGLMPFWAAYWIWIGMGLAAFWSAVRRVATGWAVPLSLASPHAVLVCILGQTTLVVGSIVIWSLTLLEKRPLLAGALIGIAAGLKPQVVVLAPVALVSANHWRALGMSVVALLVFMLATLPFGPGVWLEWFQALGSLPEDVEVHGLNPLGATPWMAGRVLGFDPADLLLLQVVEVFVAIALVWSAFKFRDLGLRLSALIFGSFLASPYAMRYDLATLAPVFATALLSGTLRGLLVSVPLFALQSLTIFLSLVVSLIAQATKPKERAA